MQQIHASRSLSPTLKTLTTMHTVPIMNHDAPIYDDPVDQIEPLPDERGDLAGALVRIVVWQVAGGEPKKVAARTLLLATALQLNARNTTYAGIAANTGITRAGVQLMAIELEEQFGIKTLNARKEATRTKCSKAQKLLQR